MKELQVSKRELDYDAFIKRTALERDYTDLIEESVLLKDGDNVVAVYLELDLDTTALVAALKRIKYQTSERTGGLISTSRVFGYQPRIALRRDFCTVTSLATEDAAAHGLVMDFGRRIAEEYQRFVPTVFDGHLAAVAQVLPDYRVPGTPFTSGIINFNNPLKYHFDAGNFKNVYSNMVVFKQDIDGGFLSLPEYNVGLQLKHNSVLLFDGQKVMHGVTPIKRRSREAYRYSIVYYALKAMWKCQTIDDELIRIRKLKTQRERKRLEYGKTIMANVRPE